MNFDKKKAIRIIKEFDEITKEMNVEYFLAFGTCLELKRDNGFIHTSKDIDIGVIFNKQLPIRKLVRKLIERGYVLDRQQNLRLNMRNGVKYSNIPSFYSFTKDDIPLDIYLFFVDKKNSRYVGGRKYTIPIKLLDEFEVIERFGIKFNVPSPVDEYLTYRYGDWRDREWYIKDPNKSPVNT